MSYQYNEIMKLINKGIRPMLAYQISKEEIESGDLSGIQKFFKTITRVGVNARQSVHLMVDGYNDIPDELYEIPEVRSYVRKLFRKIPYVLYYISVDVESERWLLTSMADSYTSTKPIEYGKMNAYEIAKKYGANPPEVMAKITFESGRLSKDVLSGILPHGKQLGDLESAKRIVVEYALRFDDAEGTIRDLNIKL